MKLSLVLLAAIVAGVQGDASSNACSTLQTLLKTQVSFPNSTTYNQESFGSPSSPNAGYWSNQEAELIPTCRVTTTSAQDVSTAVGVLVAQKAPFAIRSGGYLQNAGAANIDDGVTIDLTQLSFITVGTRDGVPVVSLGPGATWDQVYNKLDPLYLGVAGAMAKGVGVAGYLLGGGISYYSAQEGFGCDNVLEYEVVLANSTIVTASATKNQDLWMALKGGNNNFGIVTKFVLSTIKTCGSIWGGEMRYPNSTFEQQIEAMSAFAENAGSGEDDASNVIQFFVNQPSSNLSIVVNALTNTEGMANPPILHNFTSVIAPVLKDTRRQTNMSDFVVEATELMASGHRDLMATITFNNSVPMMLAAKSMFDEAFAPLANVKGLTTYLEFLPIHKRIYEQSIRQGGNSLGLTASSGNLIWCVVIATWDSATDDRTVTTALEILAGSLNHKAVQLGVQNPYIYLNYALPTQDPMFSYNATNLANLRAASSKYDPSQVFRWQVPGGFKLFPQD